MNLKTIVYGFREVISSDEEKNIKDFICLKEHKRKFLIFPSHRTHKAAI